MGWSKSRRCARTAPFRQGVQKPHTIAFTFSMKDAPPESMKEAMTTVEVSKRKGGKKQQVRRKKKRGKRKQTGKSGEGLVQWEGPKEFPQGKHRSQEKAIPPPNKRRQRLTCGALYWSAKSVQIFLKKTPESVSIAVMLSLTMVRITSLERDNGLRRSSRHGLSMV